MAPEHTVASSEWRQANRANWDERVRVHLDAPGYDLSALRGGHGRLNAIEEDELPPMQGLRVLHLQCHFGRDSLTLAQRGAEVVGLDFSHPAIEAAEKLAAELGLAGRTRFVEADLYDALVNKRLAGAISAAGQPAIGICASDAGCFLAEPMMHDEIIGGLGFVGSEAPRPHHRLTVVGLQLET